MIFPEILHQPTPVFKCQITVYNKHFKRCVIQTYFNLWVHVLKFVSKEQKLKAMSPAACS